VDDEFLKALAGRTGKTLAARGLFLATAESCTGGWIAKLLTDIAGSSGWFERGWVTYGNAAKTELLGVPAALIEREGAVSEAVALAMVTGARERSGAGVAVAVTGIAGPDGGSETRPVGTVWLAWAWPDGRLEAERRRFSGGRDAVRRASVARALERITEEFRGNG
jgi:nicotinamide-nucleotide amidase